MVRQGSAVWKECVKDTDTTASTTAASATTTPRPQGQKSKGKRKVTPTPAAGGAATGGVGASSKGTSKDASPTAGLTTGTAGKVESGVVATEQATIANAWLEDAPSGAAITTGSRLAAGSAPKIEPVSTMGHLVSVASLAATAPMVAIPAAGAMQHVQETTHSGEVFLMEMLAAMDQHMQQLRETQQGLVATVELACRRALGHNFVRLVLVGSVALRVETPGSDVDVVCFTRRDEATQQIAPDGTAHYESVGLPVDVLRRVHWALSALVSQYADNGANFSMELIDDARVPILRVLWGSAIAVDVSVDQSRPVDHVRWFQRVGAAPRPTAPPPAVAPLVTLTLRCVKWWLRQRQVPRTKEGGLPTLAWLLMAVHVCSLPATHEQAIISGGRPMVALLASLAAFFHHYTATDGLDGVLVFAADGSSSEFRRNAEKRSPTSIASNPWAELSVLDPTREGVESLELAARQTPATQLLMVHELRRASQKLDRVPKGRELAFGDGRRVLEEVFEPLPEGLNALPSFHVNSMSFMAGFFLSKNCGTGLGTVEIGMVDRIMPRPGWTAPFLHRSDERSEVFVRLLDVEERSNRCATRKKSNEVCFAPCHFICRATLERDGHGTWRLDDEALDRFKSMKQYMSELSERQQKLREKKEEVKPEARPAKVVEPSTATAANDLAEHQKTLPSPARSSTKAL